MNTRPQGQEEAAAWRRERVRKRNAEFRRQLHKKKAKAHAESTHFRLASMAAVLAWLAAGILFLR